MMDNSLINNIIIKAISDEALTSTEHLTLNQWLTDEENSKLFENLKNKDYLLQKLIEAHEVDVEADKIMLEQKLKIGKRIHIGRQWKMFRDLATSAAAVLILAAATFFWLNTRKPEGKTEPKEKTGVVAQNDIAPGKTTALLTLADGRKVMLDSTVVGQLAKEGETVVQNENATLVYQGKDHAQKEELFNTLSTTNGQTYKMVLADGSKVWLNTGASIRYPVAFTGSERKVEITGEAYFEVAKNANKPFIVDILPSTGGAGGGRGQRVEVLGTHFNINAYNDDSVIKTTLLEGSVKVRQGNSVTLLKPAQQAQVGNGVTKLIHHANVEAVTAWKNGRFNFDKADIMVVMGQLAKWYNVEVVYEGAKPTKLFVGEMERNQMLSQVVKMLEYTEGVHFRIEGRQLIVMSPEMFEARKSDKKQQK